MHVVTRLAKRAVLVPVWYSQAEANNHVRVNDRHGIVWVYSAIQGVLEGVISEVESLGVRHSLFRCFTKALCMLHPHWIEFQ